MQRIKFFLSKRLSLLLILAVLLMSPMLSFAQEDGENIPSSTNDSALSNISGRVKNPISAETVEAFIKKILQGVIKLAIPVIALAIIYSGFLFVSARGNEEKLKTAKDALLYTCIGAAILLGAWALAQLISETVLSL